MASNILLLASKKVFPTSQGLVGAGMNCRALIPLIAEREYVSPMTEMPKICVKLFILVLKYCRMEIGGKSHAEI